MFRFGSIATAVCLLVALGSPTGVASAATGTDRAVDPTSTSASGHCPARARRGGTTGRSTSRATRTRRSRVPGRELRGGSAHNSGSRRITFSEFRQLKSIEAMFSMPNVDKAPVVKKDKKSTTRDGQETIERITTVDDDGVVEESTTSTPKTGGGRYRSYRYAPVKRGQIFDAVRSVKDTGGLASLAPATQEVTLGYTVGRRSSNLTRLARSLVGDSITRGDQLELQLTRDGRGNLALRVSHNAGEWESFDIIREANSMVFHRTTPPPMERKVWDAPTPRTNPR